MKNYQQFYHVPILIWVETSNKHIKNIATAGFGTQDVRT